MTRFKRMVTALAVVGVMGLCGNLHAATVDGKVTASDGYTEVYSVTWTIAGMEGMMGEPAETFGTLVGGTLWQQRDVNGKLTNFALRLPKAFVDNTYGANTVGTYGGMGGGSHSFSDLLGSDQTTFQILGMNDEVLVEFKADYIAEILSGGTTTSGMMGGTTGGTTSYKSAGVLDQDQTHPTGGNIQDKADGAKVAAADSLAMQIPLVATSLEHNLAYYGLDPSSNPGMLDLLVDSPPVIVDINNEPILDAFGNYQIDGDAATKAFWANWEFALIFEIQIDPSKFTTGMPINALPSNGHASPSKLEGDSLTDPVPTPIPVPQPASLAMLGLAALTLSPRRRRRSA